MITFKENDTTFTLRAVGIIINGSEVLLHQVENESFWALPGGRVEYLEKSEDTIKREFLEELGIRVMTDRLLWVVETFGREGGKSFHELGFYYHVSVPENSYILEKHGPFFGIEQNPRLVFQWFALDELESVRLYSAFLRKGLSSLPEHTQHIIHTDLES